MRRHRPPASGGASRPLAGDRGRPDRTDPLAGIERLVVDGTNVIYALGDGREPSPPAALVGRLRSAVPAAVVIDLVFDGPPAPGLGRRIGPGLRVHHAADRPADDLIVALVAEAAAGVRAARPSLGPSAPGRSTVPRPAPKAAASERPRVLVVTDDAELARRVRRRGAATAPVAWLLARLARPRLAAPAAGRRRPPASSSGISAAEALEDSDDREPWRPGRHATNKRGNPRRRPRRGGHGAPL